MLKTQPIEIINHTYGKVLKKYATKKKKLCIFCNIYLYL